MKLKELYDDFCSNLKGKSIIFKNEMDAYNYFCDNFLDKYAKQLNKSSNDIYTELTKDNLSCTTWDFVED